VALCDVCNSLCDGDECVKRQQAHMKRRREQGLCEVGGCDEKTGAKWRCERHAREAALRAWRLRNPEKCACGSLSASGACAYYKSGRHVLVRAAEVA
jgi:hypothetical protein